MPAISMTNDPDGDEDKAYEDLTPEVDALTDEEHALAERAAKIAAAPLVPDPPRAARLAAIRVAKNPLLEAVQPLLRALADMPKELEPAEIDVFHRLLEREVRTFDSLCLSAQIRPEHANAASYALCTALDEAANGTAWGRGRDGDVGPWSSRQLAAAFHANVEGGVRVFLLIGRLMTQKDEHIDLLEVLYMILGLGFEGRYRNVPQGGRDLGAVRNRLYLLLAEARGDVPVELSPHWRGIGGKALRRLFELPVWVGFSVVALACFAQFAWYKYQLLQMSADVERQIVAIGQLRRPPAPPTPPVSPLRLKELLAPEIERGMVSVNEQGARTAVSLRGDDMFVPGQARLSARIGPVLAKVGDEIGRVGGTVQVTGHSDNQPIRTREFPDNQALSEKRAAAVAEMLQARGVAAGRLRVEGNGDTAPVADNATAAGRARNRRVDIVVMQGAQVASAATRVAPARPAEPTH